MRHGHKGMMQAWGRTWAGTWAPKHAASGLSVGYCKPGVGTRLQGQGNCPPYNGLLIGAHCAPTHHPSFPKIVCVSAVVPVTPPQFHFYFLPLILPSTEWTGTCRLISWSTQVCPILNRTAITKHSVPCPIWRVRPGNWRTSCTYFPFTSHFTCACCCTYNHMSPYKCLYLRSQPCLGHVDLLQAGQLGPQQK